MFKTIESLITTIKSRKGKDVKLSYTSFLLSKGSDFCLSKLKEEVNELEHAIKNKKNTVHETVNSNMSHCQTSNVELSSA